jgi:hypothetical protein
VVTPGRWRRWLSARLGSAPDHAALPPEVLQARELVAAVDAGGLPLNPARVNAVARALGLEVSTRAPVEQTVERIRAALARLEQHGPG